MLDLRVTTGRLTQGRPPAEMTFSVQRASSPERSEPAPRARITPETTKPPTVDPYAIAGRVYELLRQDLAVFRDRRGPRR